MPRTPKTSRDPLRLAVQPECFPGLGRSKTLSSWQIRCIAGRRSVRCRRRGPIAGRVHGPARKLCVYHPWFPGVKCSEDSPLVKFREADKSPVSGRSCHGDRVQATLARTVWTRYRGVRPRDYPNCPPRCFHALYLRFGEGDWERHDGRRERYRRPCEWSRQRPRERR